MRPLACRACHGTGDLSWGSQRGGWQWPHQQPAAPRRAAPTLQQQYQASSEYDAQDSATTRRASIRLTSIHTPTTHTHPPTVWRLQVDFKAPQEGLAGAGLPLAEVGAQGAQVEVVHNFGIVVQAGIQHQIPAAQHSMAGVSSRHSMLRAAGQFEACKTTSLSSAAV